MTDYCVIFNRVALASGWYSPWRVELVIPRCIKGMTLMEYIEQEYTETWGSLERVKIETDDDGTVTVTVTVTVVDEQQYCLRHVQGGLPD